MMKSILWILLFTAGSFSAQITINQNDMPVSGDIFPFSMATNIEDVFQESGENILWDLSSLDMISQDVDSFFTVSETPFLYQFFFNNEFLYPDYEADVTTKGADLDVQLITVTDVYNYYKNDSEGFRMVGIGATVNSLPQSIRYDPIDWIYEFPLTFGDSFSGSSFVAFSLPELGYISQDKETSTVVDGWGVLELSMGSFETIRLKKIINATDSVYNEAFSFGIAVPRPEETQYLWLAAGEPEPVLDVSVVNGLVVNIKYKDNLVNGIAHNVLPSISLSPNPAKDFIRIRSSVPLLSSEVFVVNAIGQYMNCNMTMDGAGLTIDVTSLDKGIYYLVVDHEGTFDSKTFVIQ